MKILSVLVPGAIGAVAAYFMDRRLGRRRRAVVTDKLTSAVRTGATAADATARDMGNRTRGALAWLRGAFRRDDPPDDVIAARIRSRVGGVVRHPRSITVGVTNGTVILTGEVLAHEVPRLLRRVRRVRGVRAVDNRLEVYGVPGDTPDLQGSGTPNRTVWPMQEYWSPTQRVGVALGGSALAAYGLKSRGVVGVLAGVAGLTALSRAGANVPLKRLVGIRTGRRAVDVAKTITVAAPVDEVFELWSRYEDFPRFMSHVREVQRTADGHAHWTLAAPGGVPIEFDTIETERAPNRLIAWKTVAGAPVAHAGVARFDPVRGGTRIHVRMSYDPVGGALGHAAATLFRADPRSMMHEDLVRLKSLLEHGKTAADGGTVVRDELA